jgi:nucleotide-binding universal stress UspA family protein
MQRYKSTFEKGGYHVSNAYFTIGDPVEQILTEAQQNNCSMIVLGSHGTSGRFTDWLLGSVSAKVLESSEISVAILR